MTGNFVLVADHLRDEVDAAPDRATAEARAAALALVFDLNATVVPTSTANRNSRGSAVLRSLGPSGDPRT
ncbi:hypothetical protein OKA06_19110 [Novosphingobium sp. MW5]|nr:hypothetical protein [Novosphingobium sp. MW5]